MKKTYLLTLSACLFITLVSAQIQSKEVKRLFHETKGASRTFPAFTYILSTVTEPYADLTGATSINNGEIWDDPDYVVPVTFPFVILGTDITTLEFYDVGSLLRSATEDPLVDVYVFPFQVDLIDRGALGSVSLSPISYKVEGSAGNHILKVEWKNAGSYNEMDENGTLDMYVNFQLWLYEGSNKIEFHFGGSFINDSDVFYGGEIGPYAGIANYDETNDITTNPHFIAGNSSNPMLSMAPNPIVGTPANEIVYRLSLDEPLVVVVTGENGTSFCNPNGTATVMVSGGTQPYTYAWSNGGTTQTITNLNGGTYTVTVTDDNSTTGTESVTITNTNPIEVNASATDETAVDANDGTAIALPTGGLPPYSFEWSNGSAGFEIVGLAPGIYTVTIIDDADCTATQSVTVNAFGCPALLLGVIITDVNCFGMCDGSIQILNIDQGTPPFTYLWSNGTDGSSLNNVCAGEFSVTVLDDKGCSVSETYQIAQPTELMTNAGSTNETSQSGGNGTAWATPSGGVEPYTYEWSNGSIDSLLTSLVPGSYTVTVTDVSSCTAVQTVVVNTFMCLNLLLDEVMWNVNCNGLCDAAIQITAVLNGTAPFAYLWSNGDTTSSNELLCPGMYTVTVSDANGCPGSETYQITDQLLLNANAGSTDETDSGANDGTAWAVPTGGIKPYGYAWSNGSTDSLITGLTPGIYTVIVTESGGFCSDTQTVIVNPFQCAGQIQSGFLDISCFENCDGAAGVLLTGGIGPIQYFWNTGDTTNTLMDLCAGHYEVTIVDEGQNCAGSFAFDLIQPDILNASVEEVIHLTDSTATAISIAVTGGTSPYMYAWSGPNGFISTDQDLSDIIPGFYSVVVTDANGCLTSIDSIEVRDETVSTSPIFNFDVRIYPNPTRGQVYIDVTDVTTYLVQLSGFDGRIINTWKDVKVLNVSDVAPGIYALKFSSGEKIFVYRLIITR